MLNDAPALFLRVEELASVLRVSKETVYEWTRRRTLDAIPRIRLGRGYQFYLPDVIRWLRETRDPRRALLPATPRQVLAASRRRAPNAASGGRRADRPRTTLVSDDGPKAVAVALPTEGHDARGPEDGG